MSKNWLLGLDSLAQLPCPELLQAHRKHVSLVIEKCHWIGSVLLKHFSSSLRLGQAMDLEGSHRYGEPSTSALGLLKYPMPVSTSGQLGQIAHTDVGSITVLFSQLGGLQVLGQNDEWLFVEPKPGHAVINVGDSLRFLTGGVLRSSLHRVVSHPDALQQPRYSIAYFMRPEYDARFEAEDGVQWTGLGWHTRKFVVFRASAEEQKASAVLTGRKGYLGLWESEKSGATCDVPTT